MIKARPVSNKFWILKEGNVKIGEVNTTQNGYSLKIKGKQTVFQTLENLKIKTGIDFVNNEIPEPKKENLVYGYPVSGEIYNPMWNIKTQLPLYNKKEDSKSWFAAGYYLVNIKNKWKTILSPKLIILERNNFKGPYKTISHDTY